MGRYDTTLEAAGAKFLVVGRLLIERVQAFKVDSGQPGHHLIALNSKTGRAVKIQVKSRVAVDSGGFRVDEADFDFAVLVRLNRGTKESLRRGESDGAKCPEFSVVPKSVLTQSELIGRKFKLSRLPNHTAFQDAWHLIVKELGGAETPPAREED